MAFVDKRNGLPTFSSRVPIDLELGCGDRKRVKDSIGIDILDYPCVDIVGDIYEILEALPEDSVKAVHSHHVIEHLPDLPRLVNLLARVVQRHGALNFTVPHFSNPYFYSDATHKTPFGLYTFSYLAEDRLFKRRVPTYQRDLAFELVSVDLNFKSTPPFYGRHAFKKGFGWLFNLTNYTKEWYEENLCYLFPCYELVFTLRRL